MFGVAFAIDAALVRHIHPIIYIFWSFLALSFFGFIINQKIIIKNLKNRTLFSYKIIVFSAISYFLYNLATFYAYRFGGEVGKIDTINTAYLFIIIAFEYFVLKNSQGTKRKILATLLAILGVFFLSK